MYVQVLNRYVYGYKCVYGCLYLFSQTLTRIRMRIDRRRERRRDLDVDIDIGCMVVVGEDLRVV